MAGRDKELTPDNVACSVHNKRKYIIGEKLYPLIAVTHAAQAGKITGMLLELDNAYLRQLLVNPPLLETKVAEAVKVLKEHGTWLKADSEKAVSVEN